jgi:flagellar basal-body rod protein FlgB
MDVALSRTDRLIHAALDGLAMRHRVIGDNVANVDTPGFKTSSVEFEGALRTAIARNSAPGKGEPRLPGPQVTSSGGSGQSDGNNVDIESEMIQLAETNITYNALAQLTASRLRLLRGVITEGRR